MPAQVIEDSFCDSFLPFYRSGCQWILSYKCGAQPCLLKGKRC